MNHFKSFLSEGRNTLYNPQKAYPHLAFDEKGRIKHQTEEERFDDLLSNKPREGDEYHAKLHAILDQVEDGKSKVAPRMAQMGRIVANGGTYSDLQKFLPDMSPGSIPVHINRLRNHIDDHFQTHLPKEERVNLPAIMTTSGKNTDFNFPGDAGFESVLRHPKLKDDLDKLSRSEFYDKHLSQFHKDGRIWADFTSLNSYAAINDGTTYKQHPTQGVVAVQVTKARRYHGISNKNDDVFGLSQKISNGHAKTTRDGGRTLRQLRAKGAA